MYCLFCVVLCIVCVYMCTVLLPVGGYPIAVKYIILSLQQLTLFNTVTTNTHAGPYRESLQTGPYFQNLLIYNTF